MTLKIVFTGNCQAYSLSYVYGELFAPHGGRHVAWVDVWDEHRIDHWREVLATADIVVEQVFTGQTRVDVSDMIGCRNHIRFPDVRGNFLWPLGNVPRVGCRSSALKGAGPYTPEVGDSYLNGLIAQNVDPKDAGYRYRDADVPTISHLDRYLEIALRQQRDRDAVTGMIIADYIERRLPYERLFTTPGHPTAGLFRHLAEQVYERLELDPNRMEAALKRLVEAPFDRWTEAPVHPRVAEHLKLTYLSEDTRYQHIREGRFDFAECAQRYVANAWSKSLLRGCDLFDERAYDGALDLLDQGLREAPRSAFGYSRLALAYRALGYNQLALEAATRAIELEPFDGELVDIHQQSNLTTAQ